MENEPADIPDPNATVLYVGNLDKRVTDTMMLNILRTGLAHIKDKVLSANMFANDMGDDGYCFVQFMDNNAACQAMTFLNGREFCGKKVKVNWATNTANGGAPKVIGSSVSIYVGNLDDDINETDLRVAFDVFGEILNIKVVRDPVTNRSKNIAFISFTNKPDAEKAIREMHGAMLKTRPIKTNWATRNTKQQKDELDYDEVYKAASTENTTVYVGGVPSNAADDQVKRHFEDYGKIIDLRIFAAKNYAFIKFDSHAAAATAICKTNGTELSGSCLKSWWGKEGPDSGNSGGGGGGGSSSSHSSSSSHNYHQNQHNQQESSQNPYSNQQMTPQQQQQYMQYMYHPYYQQYQQQYYNYWMQQYQQQMAQGGGAAGGQQQGSQLAAYQAYQQAYQQQQQQQQQQGGYPPSSYQN